MRNILPVLVLALVAAGCFQAVGPSSGSDGSSAIDLDAAAVSDAGTSCKGTVSRAPSKHRPAGSACPQERAPETPTRASACPADGGTSSSVICDCTMDSDCTKGPNGRCGQWIPPPVLGCSYDECFQDSDCDGGAPCECRPSNASSASNMCIHGGNCTVDSDCGPGGYCSPSVLGRLCACPSTQLCGDAGGCYVGSTSATGSPPGPGWTQVPCICGDSCGHGYFCHTGCDTCVDDSDCARPATCNFDVLSHRWECSAAMCAP
jgi:hypothetical protein